MEKPVCSDESRAEGATTQPEPESLVRIFHRVNRLIPEEQSVVQILPDLLVADALKLMKDKGYSQLPVTTGGEVLGFFSYRSLALSLLRGESLLSGFADLRVAEFLEDPAFVTIRTELSRLVEILDRDDAVVVGQETNLQAVVTAMDVLRYLMNVLRTPLSCWER